MAVADGSTNGSSAWLAFYRSVLIGLVGVLTAAAGYYFSRIDAKLDRIDATAGLQSGQVAQNRVSIDGLTDRAKADETTLGDHERRLTILEVKGGKYNGGH